MSDSENRYIPSLSTIQRAAESLPPPEGYPASIYRVAISGGRNGRDHTLEFRRIKCRTRIGFTERWIYEGKVRMERKKEF